jgi:hypothetical protein
MPVFAGSGGVAEWNVDDLDRFATFQPRTRNSIVAEVTAFTAYRHYEQHIVDEAFEQSSTMAASKVRAAALWAASGHLQLQGVNSSWRIVRRCELL